LTSTELFYERNNFPYPDCWRGLRVTSAVRPPLELDLVDLSKFPKTSLVATLECAGNGRAFLHPTVAGEQWRLGAVSTARWSGIRLGDLLLRAALPCDAAEVRFDGADGFARSLPLAKALNPDTLLVIEMNGAPLPREHGGPLRLLVPGWYGMASVKWLAQISLLEEPYRGHFQGERYVIDGAPVREMELRAVITQPLPGAEVAGPEVLVSGYAWTGAGQVTRVVLSADAGATWHDAELQPAASAYAWRAWQASWAPRRRGRASLLARAWDSAGRLQPVRQRWNRLGYCNNASVPVGVIVR
jgi:DMSO/TMAO reductase YedYZ molybdopterin-dependent catalytic subunit